jgi:hypothetical protein
MRLFKMLAVFREAEDVTARQSSIKDSSPIQIQNSTTGSSRGNRVSNTSPLALRDLASFLDIFITLPESLLNVVRQLGKTEAGMISSSRKEQGTSEENNG